MKVLVVDDTRTNILILTKYLKGMGHTVVTADDGLKAVEMFHAEAPDLILMDIMMPVMNGYESAQKIRESCDDLEWVPIIFLSAMIQDEDIAMGIEAGGDDYLTKPVSRVVLEAKIKAMERIAAMKKTISDYARDLKAHNEKEAEELDLAKHVFGQMTRVDELEDSRMNLVCRPSTQFSGDVVAAARSPNGKLHVLLGDATGHGLAAGLTVMPVTEVFYSMTENGRPMPEIITELNSKLKRLLPVGRFVAAVFIEYDLNDHKLKIWNGGLPPVYCVSNDGSFRQVIQSGNLALGVVDGELFGTDMEVIDFAGEDFRVYFFSDGLQEAEDRQGVQFGMPRIERALNSYEPDRRLEKLLNEVTRHVGSETAQDDISIVELQCH